MSARTPTGGLGHQAALAAVRQWEYTPTVVNASPVLVIMTVTVPF